MKSLHPLVVVGICTFIVGCGQSDSNRISEASNKQAEETTLTASRSNDSKTHEIRFKPISLNNSDSSIYIPSESDTESTNLSELALNGPSGFGYSESQSSESVFQIQTTSEQPEFQSVGSFGL